MKVFLQKCINPFTNAVISVIIFIIVTNGKGSPFGESIYEVPGMRIF